MKFASYNGQYAELLKSCGLQELPQKLLRFARFEKREFLSLEGQPIQNLLLIVSGTAAATILQPNGKSLLLSFCTAPALIGEVEFFTQQAIATTCTYAVTPVSCIAIDCGNAAGLLRANNDFLRCSAQILARRLDRCSRNSALNLLYPLETRFCAYIDAVTEGELFCENLTRTAELLGASYRHLLRTLEDLQQIGVLRKQERGYRIENRTRLRELGCSYFRMDG